MKNFHNSRYEILLEKIKTCIDTFEFMDRISIERFSEKDVYSMLKFALGRHDHNLGEYKMGGRKSRINWIIKRIQLYPVFSDIWYCVVTEIEERYAKSTVMKALKKLVESVS